MKTFLLILSVVAVTALAAAPAQAQSRKQVPRQQIMPQSDIGRPVYNPNDPDVVYSNRNPFRVIGKSSDPRIRSRMREDLE